METEMKGYLSPSSELDKHPSLVHLLRLLMSVDALRASHRWFKSLTKDETHLGKHDTLFATITMMGWAHETIATLRKGVKKRWLSRSIVEGDVELETLWDKYVPKQSKHSILDKFAYIRDKCAFHWDQDPPERCLKRLAKEKDQVPFVESDDEKGAFLSTRYPIVYDAIAGIIVDAKVGDADNPSVNLTWEATLREIGDIIGEVTKLTVKLASKMFEKLPLKLVEK